MTLGEKAKEYVFSNPPSVVIDNHSYFLPSDLKKAYIVGAKENGVVWHNLKENPDDLPKVGHIVFLSYYDKTTETGYARLDEVFCKSADDDICTKEVIAWCEIPTFDKE